MGLRDNHPLLITYIGSDNGEILITDSTRESNSTPDVETDPGTCSNAACRGR